MTSRQQIQQWYLDERHSLFEIARKLDLPIQTVRTIAQEERWVWRPLHEFVQHHRGVDVVVFDLETSGLPLTRGFNRYYPYTHHSAYESSRIIQLAYCRYRIGQPIQREQIFSTFRKPDGFHLSTEAQKIHGLTEEWLMEHGQPLSDCIAEFLRDLQECQLILAHNAGFDVNIAKNELVRLGYTPTQIDTQWFPASKIRCTCQLTDFTRLNTLYSWVDSEPLAFHNAHDDVLALSRILNFLALQ